MMTFDQIKTLLAMATARDNRNPSQAMALAWNQDLSDLDFNDCIEAMNRHYRLSEPVWLTPQHIRSRVRDIREERRRGTSEPLQLLRRPEDPAERRSVNARGADLCRQAAAPAIEAAERRRDGVDVDPIRELALQRARREKRERLLAPARNAEMPGLVRQATRHMSRTDGGP